MLSDTQLALLKEAKELTITLWSHKEAKDRESTTSEFCSDLKIIHKKLRELVDYKEE